MDDARLVEAAFRGVAIVIRKREIDWESRQLLSPPVYAIRQWNRDNKLIWQCWKDSTHKRSQCAYQLFVQNTNPRPCDTLCESSSVMWQTRVMYNCSHQNHWNPTFLMGNNGFQTTNFRVLIYCSFLENGDCVVTVNRPRGAINDLSINSIATIPELPQFKVKDPPEIIDDGQVTWYNSFTSWVVKGYSVRVILISFRDLCNEWFCGISWNWNAGCNCRRSRDPNLSVYSRHFWT
jgi:hypothetical protein